MVDDRTDDRADFLAEVAWLSHEFQLTQEEIARRFSVSRSSISRALADAQRVGIVQVVITAPMRREARLGAELTRRLGVTATVGRREADEAPVNGAARAAARLLERIGDSGHATVAVSWGRTLAATAELVRPRMTTGMRIVDAVGHPGASSVTPTVEVTSRLAAALGAAVVHLPSPAFVAPGASHDALLANEPVRHALEVARAADATLVSVGVVGDASLLLAGGMVDTGAMSALLAAGAVGEVMGRWLDADGRSVRVPGLAEVGLTLDDLRASRRVIEVAAGADKASVTLAAIRGGIVHELVIDDDLAEALLAAAEDQHADGPAPAIPEPLESVDGGVQ